MPCLSACYQTDRQASVARLPAGSADWSAAQSTSSSAPTHALPLAASLAASGRAALGWREFVSGCGDEVWGNVLSGCARQGETLRR
jgi:hypothetical protein